jgi:hypothetical protein
MKWPKLEANSFTKEKKNNIKAYFHLYKYNGKLLELRQYNKTQNI